MFGLVKGIMTGASARFTNIALGRNDLELAKKYFSVGLTIYAGLCVIFFVLAESIGVWFVNTQLNIPTERMVAANWVFQFSILILINSLLSVPYSASIIAHEKMGIYAYVGIVEVLLKLGIAYLIIFVTYDRLIVYGFLLLLSEVIVRMIYRCYCVKSYIECRYHFYKEKSIYKEVISFSAWNIFGVSSTLIKGQGLNILLSMFFSPSVNAARGIAYQVNHAILQFSNNFYMSVRPQITKNYARNEFANMHKLIFRSSKMTLYLMLALSLPVLLEAPYIIQIWLGQTPEYVIVFVRYMIVISIIESMANPIITAVHATGKVSFYQITQGSITALNIPISYIFLKFGHSPTIVFQVSLLIAIILSVVRVLILRRLMPFPAISYISEVLLKGVFVFVLSLILPYYVNKLTEPNLIHVIGIIILTEICIISVVYAIGLNSEERLFVKNIINTFIHKFKKQRNGN